MHAVTLFSIFHSIRCNYGTCVDTLETLDMVITLSSGVVIQERLDWCCLSWVFPQVAGVLLGYLRSENPKTKEVVLISECGSDHALFCCERLDGEISEGDTSAVGLTVIIVETRWGFISVNISVDNFVVRCPIGPRFNVAQR